MPPAAIRRARRSWLNPVPSPQRSTTMRGGWVLHHNFDLWRGTAPINACNHGIWQTGGAWLSTHLWEHYLFTGDREFLRDHRLSADERRFPVLRRHPGEGSQNRLPVHRPQQLSGAGRAGDGSDDGPRDCAHALRRNHRRRQSAERRCRFARSPFWHAQTDRAAPDRQARPVTGMDGRYGRSEEPAPPRIAPLGRVPGQRDHALRHARSLQGRASSR